MPSTKSQTKAQKRAALVKKIERQTKKIENLKASHRAMNIRGKKGELTMKPKRKGR